MITYIWVIVSVIIVIIMMAFVAFFIAYNRSKTFKQKIHTVRDRCEELSHEVTGKVMFHGSAPKEQPPAVPVRTPVTRADFRTLMSKARNSVRKSKTKVLENNDSPTYISLTDQNTDQLELINQGRERIYSNSQTYPAVPSVWTAAVRPNLSAEAPRRMYPNIPPYLQELNDLRLQEECEENLRFRSDPLSLNTV